MLNLKYFIIALLFMTFMSCEKNLMEDIESGSWNNEKSVLNIKFTSQLGAAAITRDDISGNGEISFFILDTLITSNLSLKIEELNLSYGALSDKNVGDIVTFGNDSTATITITSQTGLNKEWQIRWKKFEDVIIGVWDIKILWVYGGMQPQYGGTIVYDMSVLPELQQFDYPPTKEYDNTLTFTLGGVTIEGDSYGTVYNDAGLDGEYADFIFVADTTADVNKFYRKIPKGISNWSKNVVKNTITCTPLEGGSSNTCSYIEAGTYQLDVQKSITITDNALMFGLYQPPYLPSRYTRKSIIVDSPQEYYIEIKKQNNK